MQETQVRSLGWEDPLEKRMATPSVFVPGDFHALRSLAGYSLWGRKGSDMTERLSTHVRIRQTDRQTDKPTGAQMSLRSGSVLVKTPLHPSMLPAYPSLTAFLRF